ncbi:hypothetical protein Y032_1331g3830, partial [Ancylostoma ceylanicum]
MIRIDCHVDRLERCQTELIAGALDDVPTMKWRYFAGGRGDRQFEMNQNEPAIEEIRVVEMIRIDCHVDRLERCQTELIAGALDDVPTMKWR